MVRSPTVLITLWGAMLAAITAAAPAGEFQIDVKIDAADRHVQTKETLETPTAKAPQPRPVVELLHDQAAHASWHAENTSKSEEFSNLLVHFFVVREKEIGQAEIPKLTADVTYEGALTTDFNPHETADWQWTLKIHEPGNYLLRVETIGMPKQHGREYFVAMDLIVK